MTSSYAIVEAMRSHAFTFAAAPRSYWDMYFGYGLEAAFVCLVEALLFWRLSAASPADIALVRSIAALFAVANVAHCVMLVRATSPFRSPCCSIRSSHWA